MIGVLLLVGVPILWLIFNSGTLTPVERDAATREFEFQLQHREFAALEAHIGRRIPPALMALYANRELLTGQSWMIAMANPGKRSHESHIAFFQPATLASMRATPAGPSTTLAFANDGLGNEYCVDLMHDDATISYVQHETGRQFDLEVSIGQFLQLPRRQLGESDI